MVNITPKEKPIPSFRGLYTAIVSSEPGMHFPVFSG